MQLTLDTSDSYLITYLFEPDSFPYTTAAAHIHSLVNMGYISGDDALYRSEVSKVADIVSALAEVRGDANGDGKVDIADVMTAIKAVLNESMINSADMNNDGELTLDDVLRLLKRVAI